MSKGKPIADTLGYPGQVVYDTATQMIDLYEVSVIKNPKYDIGDKIDLADGRVFRYCLSGDVCDTYKANIFYNAIPATGSSLRKRTQYTQWPMDIVSILAKPA